MNDDNVTGYDSLTAALARLGMGHRPCACTPKHHGCREVFAFVGDVVGCFTARAAWRDIINNDNEQGQPNGR